MNADDRAYRIGEVAQRVGVTTRTIRYYEELGLLGCDAARAKGAHRLYSEANVARLQELIRLRDLLGLSLDELIELAESEEAGAALRDQWESGPDDAERLRIVEAAIPLVERRLALVHARQETLGQLARELEERQRTLQTLRRELTPRAPAAAAGKARKTSR
jgi:DNA-binding transcriptional MerR regulator